MDTSNWTIVNWVLTIIGTLGGFPIICGVGWRMFRWLFPVSLKIRGSIVFIEWTKRRRDKERSFHVCPEVLISPRINTNIEAFYLEVELAGSRIRGVLEEVSGNDLLLRTGHSLKANEPIGPVPIMFLFSTKRKIEIHGEVTVKAWLVLKVGIRGHRWPIKKSFKGILNLDAKHDKDNCLLTVS